MSIRQLTNSAVGYSRAMDVISRQAQDPTLIQDPARLAVFQQQMYYAQSGYTLTVNTIKEEKRMNDQVAELMRE